MQVSVVDYGDCTGNTGMTRVAAVHYLCTPGSVTTLIGHNPGVFTPLLRTHAGDIVSYSAGGVSQDFVIGNPVRVSPSQAAEYTQDSSYAHMVLTTCAEPDSSTYWVFIARPVAGSGGRTGERPWGRRGRWRRPSAGPVPQPAALATGRGTRAASPAAGLSNSSELHPGPVLRCGHERDAAGSASPRSRIPHTGPSLGGPRRGPDARADRDGGSTGRGRGA